MQAGSLSPARILDYSLLYCSHSRPSEAKFGAFPTASRSGRHVAGFLTDPDGMLRKPPSVHSGRSL